MEIIAIGINFVLLHYLYWHIFQKDNIIFNKHPMSFSFKSFKITGRILVVKYVFSTISYGITNIKEYEKMSIDSYFL